MERIVVGFDNSAGAAAALRWAAEYAAAHSCRLEAVCVIGGDAIHAGSHNARTVRDEYESLRAVENILQRSPSHDIAIRIVTFPPRGGLPAALLSAAKGAELLVVGQPESPTHADLADALSNVARCEVVEVAPDGTGRALGGVVSLPAP